MQALRHGARQALRTSVAVREPFAVSARACSTDAATKGRMSKAQRQQCASQFVEKFKASNDGQLPSLNLLRKEVGGSYDVLKEVMQGFEKSSGDEHAGKKSADLKKRKTQEGNTSKQGQQNVEDLSQHSVTSTEVGQKKKLSSTNVNLDIAANMPDPHSSKDMTEALSMLDQDQEEVIEASSLQGEQKDKEQARKVSDDSEKEEPKRQSVSKKDKTSVQDKKPTSQGVEHVGEMKSVKQRIAKTSSVHVEKQSPSSTSTEDTLESLMDTLTTDEDDDDDSDVAAPEYQQQTLMMQIKEGRSQPSGSDLNIKSLATSKNDDHLVKSGLQLKEDNKVEKVQKGLGAVKGMIPSMVKSSSDCSFGSGSRPPTTVLRIVNLPVHISAHQLKSTCESIAKVHAVNLRRGRIADVHFDVDLREMNGVLERLRKVILGSAPLKVFPALRFSCESSTSSRFIPRNVQEIKHMRNNLIHAFEQRFKFLSFHIQDFHELHNLKVAKRSPACFDIEDSSAYAYGHS